MAGPTRPSGRSIPLRNAPRDEAPATVLQHDDTPSATRPTKRARDASLTNGLPTVTKKQKIDKVSDKLRSTPAARNRIAKPLPPTTKSAATPPGVVTHIQEAPVPRVTKAVQPLANGTIATNGLHNPINASTDGRTLVGQARKEADKRTLRSQDGGSRSKSELCQYFPNYEELISLEPKQVGKISQEFYKQSHVD